MLKGIIYGLEGAGFNFLQGKEIILVLNRPDCLSGTYSSSYSFYIGIQNERAILYFEYMSS
jgi:hypothetical protein